MKYVSTARRGIRFQLSTFMYTNTACRVLKDKKLMGAAENGFVTAGKYIFNTENLCHDLRDFSDVLC